MTNRTQALAEFCSQLTYEDLPGRIKNFVKGIYIDTIASGIAGRAGAELGMVERLADQAGSGSSPTIASTPRSPIGAVLLNGYLITAVTVCDVYREAWCHVTPEVVPPIIVGAEEAGSSGKDILTALAIGLEVTVRAGKALNYPAFRSRGWHAPGVIGPLGGATALGSLLKLSTEEHTAALALAGSQSAGTFAQWGTPTIKFQQSRGALSGYMAARLASEGLRGSTDIFGHSDGGLFTTYSDGGLPESLTADLGQHWELERIALRMWPAASTLQTMVTALLALTESNDIRIGDVEFASIELSDHVYKMHHDLAWDTRFTAPLSIPYLTAVVLRDRACWLDQFSEENLTDPELNSFAKHRVVMSEHPDLEGTASKVTLRLKDGSTVEDTRHVPKGDPEDPLSIDDISHKLRTAARPYFSTSVVEACLDDLLDLEGSDDPLSPIRLLERDL